MKELSIDQVCTILDATDLRYEKHEASVQIPFAMGGTENDCTLVIQCRVNDGRLMLDATVPATRLSTEQTTVEEAARGVSVQHPGPCPTVTDVAGLDEPVLHYWQYFVLPACPTPVVGALVHNFNQLVLDHVESVISFLAETKELASNLDSVLDRMVASGDETAQP